MTKATRTNPITRLVKRMLPSQAQAQPAPEPEELAPTVKMSRFIKYGD